MKLFPILLLIGFGLSACTQHVNTMPSEQYIQKLNSDGSQMQIDKSIARSAKVEPNLKFPARIGVARIINGRLRIAPAKEAALMQDFAKRNQQYGTFAPVSQLIAETVINNKGDVLSVIELRHVAARQHFDYLLVYKIDVHDVNASRWERKRTPRNTIVAQAALIDVRNGYAYAAIQESLNDRKVRLGGRNTSTYKDRAAQYAFEEMMPDVEGVFAQLKAGQ
ncbi:hypothetical protein [Parasulfitobacter algicola]|uniref:Lipoprotein n=1 Tax=Parasulfitobacter algicola TaxID=2614809 RepID=A0ABX2ITL4_9RHOB|nr:hypothetical protein [Sulfitobacter algicola]NSX53709.1 hypothetical protein [Sulfitobacter algicola]